MMPRWLGASYGVGRPRDWVHSSQSKTTDAFPRTPKNAPSIWVSPPSGLYTFGTGPSVCTPWTKSRPSASR